MIMRARSVVLLPSRALCVDPALLVPRWCCSHRPVFLQIGLLALALVPMMAAAAVVQMQMMNGSYGDSGGLDGGAKAGVILGGALNGMTTVTALNMQDVTSSQYDEVL